MHETDFDLLEYLAQDPDPEDSFSPRDLQADHSTFHSSPTAATLLSHIKSLYYEQHISTKMALTMLETTTSPASSYENTLPTEKNIKFSDDSMPFWDGVIDSPAIEVPLLVTLLVMMGMVYIAGTAS